MTTDRRHNARARSDRRRNVRIAQSLELRTLSEDGELSLACAADIGEDGMFVEYVLPYPEGTQLRVEFVLPGAGAMWARAKVVSAQTWLAPDQSARPGNGLRFLDMDDEARGRLSRWLEAQIG
jgi:hypothetical protein